MKINVHLESNVAESFRVKQAAGMFDCEVGEKSTLDISVHLPEAGDAESSGGDWSVGAIVGPSGSGKSAVARQAYGDQFVEAFDWPADKAIVDCFDEQHSMGTIAGVLNSVGFSSPPAWVLPYQALSNGQRFRCDLARALLPAPAPEDGKSAKPQAVNGAGGLVAFDEFTSVVDRQVGQFASASVAKAVRQGRVAVKQFVAVTCHYDVLDWLEPDWVLDMADRKLIFAPGFGEDLRAELPRGSLHPIKEKADSWQRPKIKIEVRRALRESWALFSRHHYLSSALHKAARCYVAYWPLAGGNSGDTSGGEPVAFLATLTTAGHPGRRMVHRLVVLPDFQGMGIGLRVLDRVVAIEAAKGYTMGIRTSHPALLKALSRGRVGLSGGWELKSLQKHGSRQGGYRKVRKGGSMGSWGRCVGSFEWQPVKACAANS